MVLKKIAKKDFTVHVLDFSAIAAVLLAKLLVGNVEFRTVRRIFLVFFLALIINLILSLLVKTYKKLLVATKNKGAIQSSS